MSISYVKPTRSAPVAGPVVVPGSAQHRDARCAQCGSPADSNRHQYADGHAFVRAGSARPSACAVVRGRQWLAQYRRLTKEIQQALVLNKDPMRKEQIDTRGLYNQRANAVAQMADALEAMLP